MTEHFWIFCGLWAGIGGSLFGYMKARPLIKAGNYTHIEVRNFLTGFALCIFIPSALFWVLQLSSGTTEVNFSAWPSPQKEMALTIMISLWATLIVWTWFFDGAKKLSKFLPLIGLWPAFMLKESGIKVMVFLLVAAGFAGLIDNGV